MTAMSATPMPTPMAMPATAPGDTPFDLEEVEVEPLEEVECWVGVVGVFETVEGWVFAMRGFDVDAWPSKSAPRIGRNSKGAVETESSIESYGSIWKSAGSCESRCL